MASSKGRLEGTRFAVLVFTNLTQDHLDFHGTMEEYFESKRRLFAQAAQAVINVGDEYGARLASELPGAITFRPDDGLGTVRLKLQGRFNVENALAAAAAARALGVDDEAIRAGHRGARPGSWTLRARRRRSAVHRPRRLRAHAGRARDSAAVRARARPRPRHLRLRRGRGPRPCEAAADGSGRHPSSPMSRSSRPTIRAARIPPRSRPKWPEISSSTSSSTGAVRSSGRSSRHGRATSS